MSIKKTQKKLIKQKKTNLKKAKPKLFSGVFFWENFFFMKSFKEIFFFTNVTKKISFLRNLPQNNLLYRKIYLLENFFWWKLRSKKKPTNYHKKNFKKFPSNKISQKKSYTWKNLPEKKRFPAIYRIGKFIFLGKFFDGNFLGDKTF